MDTLGCQFRTFLKPAVKFASDSFLGEEGCGIKSHFLGVKSLQPTPVKLHSVSNLTFGLQEQLGGKEKLPCLFYKIGKWLLSTL